LCCCVYEAYVIATAGSYFTVIGLIEQDEYQYTYRMLHFIQGGLLVNMANFLASGQYFLKSKHYPGNILVDASTIPPVS